MKPILLRLSDEQAEELDKAWHAVRAKSKHQYCIDRIFGGVRQTHTCTKHEGVEMTLTRSGWQCPECSKEGIYDMTLCSTCGETYDCHSVKHVCTPKEQPNVIGFSDSVEGCVNCNGYGCELCLEQPKECNCVKNENAYQCCAKCNPLDQSLAKQLDNWFCFECKKEFNLSEQVMSIGMNEQFYCKDCKPKEPKQPKKITPYPKSKSLNKKKH
jgi:hypothetical protein